MVKIHFRQSTHAKNKQTDTRWHDRTNENTKWIEIVNLNKKERKKTISFEMKESISRIFRSDLTHRLASIFTSSFWFVKALLNEFFHRFNRE